MDGDQRIPVVVIRSNDCSFLGIVRSLWRHKIPSICITYTWPTAPVWYSQQSPLTRANFSIENPHSDEGAAIQGLMQVGRNLFSQYGQKLLIVPSSDTSLMFLCKYEDQLLQFFSVAGSKVWDQCRQDVITKDRCAETLRANGIPTPMSFGCRGEDDIHALSQKIGYPCVYKPAIKDFAQTFYKQHQGLKAVRCENATELLQQLSFEISLGHELIVQDFVEFESASDEVPAYCYFDEHHDLILFSTGFKANIHPEPFGTAIELELTYNTQLEPLCAKIGKTLHWRGPLMIEFIKEPKSGIWQVIEINTRPWLMSDFYARSGLNYSATMYADYYGDQLERKRPSLTLLATKPLHIDCHALVQKTGMSLANLTSYLERKNNKISFTNYDPNDRQPGYLEASQLSKDFGFDRKKTVEMFERLGGST